MVQKQTQHYRILRSAFCLLLSAFRGSLLSEVAPFPAGNRVGAIYIDANCAPGSITDFVRRTIGQSINRTEIGNDTIVSAGQIRQLFTFVERAAAGVGQVLHLIM